MSSLEKNKDKNNEIKDEITPSSLKHDKFKGLTSEEIIKKYEDVLYSREKQIKYMSKEIEKHKMTIKTLTQKKAKSKYDNDILKETLSKDESLLKQELSNKEFIFMKINNFENKCDDLQNQIDYIIDKQNALAESFLSKKGKINLDNEESKKLIDKNPPMIREKEAINFKEQNKNTILVEESKSENEINKENKNDIIFEEKINIYKIEIDDSKIKDKFDSQNKKENTFISARERLNKLKEKKEKVKRLNLTEIINQKNNDNI